MIDTAAPVDAWFVLGLAVCGVVLLFMLRRARAARLAYGASAAGALLATVGVAEVLSLQVIDAPTRVRSLDPMVLETYGVMVPQISLFVLLLGGAIAAVCSVLEWKGKAR